MILENIGKSNRISWSELKNVLSASNSRSYVSGILSDWIY